MKATTTSIIFALLAAIAHAAPAPVPQSEPCNPNAHGRYCFAILYGAAGVSQNVSQEINLQVDPIDVPFSVSSISNPDNGQYEFWTFYGEDGSVTNVAPGETTDVGPPQVQTSAYCYIQCPGE